MEYSIIRPANREEWLAQREKGIGSSEVGTICGVNHFDTPLKLWRRKLHLAPPTEESEVMWAGHMLEGAVAAAFADKTGAIIDETSTNDWIAVDNQRPYLQVSPDRLWWPAGTPPEERTIENALILECKSTTARIDKNNLPQYWYFQIQYQMYVMRKKRCAIAWWSCSGGQFTFDYTFVEFKDKFFNLVLQQLITFWEVNVSQKVAPAMLCDKSDVVLMWPVIEEKSFVEIPEDDERVRQIKEYNELLANIKQLEKRKEEIAETVALTLRDKELLKCGDMILASFSTTAGRESIDKEKLKECDMEIYEKCLVKGTPSRTLKIKDPFAAKAKKKKASAANA